MKTTNSNPKAGSATTGAQKCHSVNTLKASNATTGAQRERAFKSTQPSSVTIKARMHSDVNSAQAGSANINALKTHKHQGKRKRVLAALICAAMLVVAALAMTGCGAQQEDTSGPLNLEGTWKQVNSNSSESWQQAEISGDVISIDWVTNNGDQKSVYWIGSYVAPTDNSKEYTWDSVRDKEKTQYKLMASSDDTKTITYSNGQLSYSASAMGSTMTIKLERV